MAKTHLRKTRSLAILVVAALILFSSALALAETPGSFTWEFSGYYFANAFFEEQVKDEAQGLEDAALVYVTLMAETPDEDGWPFSLSKTSFKLMTPCGELHTYDTIYVWDEMLLFIYAIPDTTFTSTQGFKMIVQPSKEIEPLEIDLDNVFLSLEEMPQDITEDITEELIEDILDEAEANDPVSDITVQEDLPVQEPSIEPDEETAPTTQGEDTLISTLLEACVVGAEKKPWESAIYAAGAEDAAYNEETVTFKLRSFNPQIKSVEDDEDAFIHMLENTQAYDLEVTLTLNEAGDGFTDKSVKAMKTAVTKAATASEAAYDNKRFLSGLTSYLFPAPLKTVTKAEEVLKDNGTFHRWLGIDSQPMEGDYSDWAPFFYGITTTTLSTKAGPNNLTVKCTGINPETLLKTASKNTLAYYSAIAFANATDSDEISEKLLEELADTAITMRKKGTEKLAIPVTIDGLFKGQVGSEYYDYITLYDYSSVLWDLEDVIRDLPDYPAIAFPKTGRLSGSTSGTKVIIKAPKGDDAYYIQLRKYSNDAFAVSAFIAAGKSCNIRVPQGDYYFLIASGTSWYGETAMFGNYGSYSRTELFEVYSSKYYHTITLRVSEGGNMSQWNSDPSDFAH